MAKGSCLFWVKICHTLGLTAPLLPQPLLPGSPSELPPRVVKPALSEAGHWDPLMLLLWRQVLAWLQVLSCLTFLVQGIESSIYLLS